MVVIGNEILTGKVEDCNSPFLCRELTALGVEVGRLITVPDDMGLIGEAALAFSRAFDWVFTSGGIGPTHDDMTIPAIARAFDVKVISDPLLEKVLRNHYGDRLTEDHLMMARVPEGTELIQIEGLFYPVISFQNLFIFPGVPELFRYKFNGIKERFRGSPATVKTLFLKADEGTIAATLRQTESDHPGILIGSYPCFTRADYTVKVTVEGREADVVEGAYARLKEALGTLPATIVREA